MYAFITGPLLWFAFIVFVAGSIYRIAEMLKLAKKDKVVYPYMNLRFGLRSIFHWIVPFASRNMRLRPVMTLVTFAFHLCLIVTPIFLLGHVKFFEMAWGIGWCTLPGTLADAMTLTVIGGSVFLLVRRLIVLEVSNVTYFSDHAFLLIVLLTFLTGFMAHHQMMEYKPLLILHILSGEIMLIAVPLTRLSHMLYFFFSRAYMGSEFGFVRNSKDW
jgi:nitrate reductase gamma subunit